MYSCLAAYVFQLDLFFQVVIRGGSDLAGKLRPEKKKSSRNTSLARRLYVFFSGRNLVWPAMFFDWTLFFSGHNLEVAKIWRERYDLKKKTYSHLAGYVFQLDLFFSS